MKTERGVETMDAVWRWICAAVGAVGTWIAYLLGGWDAALGLMFIAMGLDYVTGIICALVGRSTKTENGRFLSCVAYRGITKKLMMLVIVMVATMLDRLIGTDGVCRIAAIGFYAANEGMSIIENASAMGVPFPKGLLDTLERLRKRSDGAVGIEEQTEDKDDETKEG
jgi:toxin secretion/phage lysis holin